MLGKLAKLMTAYLRQIKFRYWNLMASVAAMLSGTEQLADEDLCPTLFSGELGTGHAVSDVPLEGGEPASDFFGGLDIALLAAPVADLGDLVDDGSDRGDRDALRLGQGRAVNLYGCHSSSQSGHRVRA